ncbi:hypothetical protein ANO11243_049630 [Dothideomycetidae sp. 11243]|nr:hypothetical protein ANO11243_049630 [fungal sp. No.11243]
MASSTSGTDLVESAGGLTVEPRPRGFESGIGIDFTARGWSATGLNSGDGELQAWHRNTWIREGSPNQLALQGSTGQRWAPDISCGYRLTPAERSPSSDIETPLRKHAAITMTLICRLHAPRGTGPD